MQKSRLWILIMIVLVLLNVFTLTFLWMQAKTAEGEGARRSTKDFIIKEVGLTNEQIILFDSLRKIHHSKIKRLNQQNRELHDQLFENISIVQIDSTLIQNISSQISKIEVEKQAITLYHFRAFRKILTTQQQNKFDSIINDVLRTLGRPGPKEGNRRPPKPGDNSPYDRNEMEPPPMEEDGPPPPPQDRL